MFRQMSNGPTPASLSNAGDRILVVNATGGWSNKGSDPNSMKGALGFNGFMLPGTKLADVSLAALIGRVGTSAFQARPDQELAAPERGRLYLGMNDIPGAVNYDDNGGSLNVVLRATPMRLPDLQGPNRARGARIIAALPSGANSRSPALNLPAGKKSSNSNRPRER
jgi:hypothetical protein